MPASLRAGGRRLPGGKAFFPDAAPPAASLAIPGPAPPSLTPMEPSGRRFNSTKPVHFQACGVVFFEAHPDRGHKPGRSHSPRSGPGVCLGHGPHPTCPAEAPRGWGWGQALLRPVSYHAQSPAGFLAPFCPDLATTMDIQ